MTFAPRSAAAISRLVPLQHHSIGDASSRPCEIASLSHKCRKTLKFDVVSEDYFS